MSYQSRLYQSKWTYEPFDVTADDFNSKVGRVLNRGAYTVGSSASFVWPATNVRKVFPAQVLHLQGQLHKSSTYSSSIPHREAGIATTHAHSGGTAELNSPFPAAATSILAAQEPCQYTWVRAVQQLASKHQLRKAIAVSSLQVDKTGKPVDSALAFSKVGQQTKPDMQTSAGLNSKPYNQEVMDLWKRVNPGVMEKYVDMPGSTMADHFKWLDPKQQEPLNRTHHLQKTDFSEYNEVAARSMKALITNKVSP